MRMQAYVAVAEHGPITGTELDKILGDGSMDPAYSRRLSELRDAGVIREVGKRPCAVTGNLAIQWEITDQLPKKEKKAHAKRPDAEIKYALGWFERHKSEMAWPEEVTVVLAWLKAGAKCPRGH